MSERRWKSVYVAGIALNAIAFANAVMNGSWLFAGVFAFVAVYLVVRLRMGIPDTSSNN
ncbi:hypothetical protein [Natrinema sp. CBA1119]|uniref:hypothetical protein n=1 Tax=Natrinema sp. CBA1119 TaxID=1608465 RepID=UPI00159BC128|nr:hypothetical protein [Natrinema sp. CBA1119]